MLASDRAGNLVAARLLRQIATMLRLQDAATYRVRAYERAADAVAMYPVPLAELAAQRRLSSIPNVGASLAKLLEEFVHTGAMGLHTDLAAHTPPGLGELLRLPGMTPATARALHDQLEISNLGDLEAAAASGRLAEVRVARRTDLLDAIAQARQGGRPLRLKEAWETARALQAQLAAGEAADVEVAGAARRMLTDVLIDGIDLVALPRSITAARLLDTLSMLPGVVEELQRDERSARVRLQDTVVVRLTVATPETWGAVLLDRTGSAQHLQRLAERATERGLRLTAEGLRGSNDNLVASHSESALYEHLDLPFIPPELREDTGEIEAAQSGSLPRLVELDDLRGDMHTHTEWTDGSAPLAAMAEAARARGYAYMALTDHSQEMSFINGLTPERLAEQRRLVDQLNHDLAPFVILHGTEMDILEDGRLDFSDDVLQRLDYVSASVHRRHKLGRAEMTERTLRAVANDLVDTLNHPFGRRLGMRDALDLDMDTVLTAAAASGCAVEVSGDPARMDLDGAWARRAGLAGCRCTISTDAHSPLDFDNAWIGLGSARRGWLTADQVLNTRPLAELLSVLRGARHRRRAS
jgi:DNA polymerase (family 10)